MLSQKITITALFIITIVFSFSYGVIVGTFKFEPYGIFNIIYDKFIPNNYKDQNYDILLPSNVNVTSLIHIHNENDILNKRMQLIKYIWKQNNFPYDKTPLTIENNITDERYLDLQNLAQINKITTSMEYGIESYSYLFLADKSNDKLIVYHQGHDGDFILGKNTIQVFLENGYSVMAFSMPLTGMNNQPVLDLNFGNLKLMTHEDLRFIESDTLSPIKFFVEPIAISLNYVDKEFDFDSYYMTGISGGGWTTVLYSALDLRIEKSYPVAGSVPLYLRFNNLKNMGDYEQMLPELYSISGYLDLYIMASYGENREQLQIFNKYDPCCFSGIGYTTYENEIIKSISELGTGKFHVFLDTNNEKHSISDESLTLILKNIVN